MLQRIRGWLRALSIPGPIRLRRTLDEALRANARLRAEAAELRAAQEALRQSEARYRRLAENVPDLIYRYRLGPDRGYEYINPAAQKILGYSPAELMAETDLAFSRFHPDDLPLIERLLGEHPVLPNPTVFRLLRRDGQVIWLEFREVGAADPQGRIIAVEGVARDVTASALAAAALQASEERYRLIADHSADLICILTLDSRYAYVSPSFETLLGHRPADLLGRSAWDLVHPDDLPQVLARWRQIAERGRAEAVYRFRLADGGWRWFEALGSAAQWRGAPVAIIAGRDITDRRRLELQLLQATKMEGIGRLAGGVAHDFNNILVVIGGYTDMAIEALPADSPALADLQVARRAVDSAAGLTRQLLAFARRQVSAPELLSLGALMGEIEPLIRRLIRADIELDIAQPADLWPVLIDPAQAEQVVMNLVVNARDAMPDGGRLLIELSNVLLDDVYASQHNALMPGPYVLLAISDTGVGMSEAVQQSLFEPFFTTKAPGQGTGLGLATCYGIVRENGGLIWVYSELGHGTTVRVYLPQANRPAADPARAPERGALPQGVETVLLVEDDPLVRAFAARVLNAQGYAVITAADGAAALALADSGALPALDLLLTDVVMPNMGGVALAAELRRRHPTLRVLYTSGYTDHGGVHQGRLEVGAALLQKPFTPAALARKVREALDA